MANLIDKKCGSCNNIKSLSDFYNNRCKPDGLAAICRVCSRIHEKRYVSKNKDSIRKTKRLYTNNKRKNDINFKLSHALRRRVNSALCRNQKGGSAVSDLGCSIPHLKLYLESRFQEGMSWVNYGIYWEIDHIMPLASFDLTDCDQFKKAVHFTNLQPLTRAQNRKKGCTVRQS